MDIRPIRSEDDYRAALQAIDGLFDSQPGTPEGDRLEVWILIVQDYERKHHTIACPDPIEAIRHEMERLDLKTKDLEPYIGSRSRVWEVLNRKRRLTLDMIRKLSAALDIPAEILVQEYELDETSVDELRANDQTADLCAVLIRNETVQVITTEDTNFRQVPGVLEWIDLKVRSKQVATRSNLSTGHVVIQCLNAMGVAFEAVGTTRNCDESTASEPAVYLWTLLDPCFPVHQWLPKSITQ